MERAFRLRTFRVAFLSLRLLVLCPGEETDDRLDESDKALKLLWDSKDAKLH